jgi:vancomycin resistance protein VanJ
VKERPSVSQQQTTRRLLRRRVVLGALLSFYGLLLALISWTNAVGPERWWVSALNLFLPQWIWGVPAILLLIAALLPKGDKKKRFDRFTKYSLFAILGSLAWVLGPVMGFCWRMPGRTKPVSGGVRLRVMTYNIKWGHRDMSAILQEIVDTQPDLLLPQDSGDTLDGFLGELLRDWNVCHEGQYIIASHLPLSDVQIGSLSFFGEKHSYLRCLLHLGQSKIMVYDIHMLTPRWGLEALRYREGISGFDRDVQARLQQAGELAQDLQRERTPVLIAGDLNAPLQSLVCRQLLHAGLQDAFAESGWGYGYTYGHKLRLHHSYMRIDHILVSAPWQVTGCWTGNAEGSDHRPVIADLLLPQSHPENLRSSFP